MSKQPRQRCGFCKGIGHNRLTCPKRADQQAKTANGVHIEPAATRDAVMRTIIDPNYALWLLSEGATGDALANATREKPPGMVGDMMLQALAELDLRAKKVPTDQIATLKALKKQHDEALSAYNSIRHEITKKLGYG
jgi:hypothetical protein